MRSSAGSNMNLLGVETPTLFWNHETFNKQRYLAATNDIVVPYPDPDAIRYYTEERLANTTKDLFAVFVGQLPRDGK